MPQDFIDFIPSMALPPLTATAAWKLAVIDDDQAVHDGTRFALENFSLNGRRMELLGARSAKEGLALLRAHPDIAVVLLDVVMETEDAGLELARAIRNELKNEIVRIILRTGQPGQAPEHRIVVEYDINDYKAKTELTAEKLFTTLTSALRSYEQLKRLDDTRVGLELIVGASAELFDDRSLQTLALGVLIQLNALLAMDSAGILVIREGDPREHSILASLGSFAEAGAVDLDFSRLFDEASRQRSPYFRDGYTHLYVKTGGGSEILVILDTRTDLSDTQLSLVSVFSAKLAVAFDNARLHERLRQANGELEARVRARTQALAAANERLETQSGQLKRVNAFKNEILGMIAHDLKNPIAVVLGRAEMLASLAEQLEPAIAEMFGKHLGHLRTAGQRMMKIVDLSLADAMTDALDVSIRQRPADLAPIVLMAVELNEGLAHAKGQSVELKIADELPVCCDPDRMAEAVDNLVSNAIKYAPAGGAIEIIARAVGADAEVSVSDDGPGLKPEDVTRLFGRFQRLSAQPTGGESSAGLGLSIVRRIVDLHGGRIDVAENGPLGGATFTLSLPLRQPKPCR